MKHPFYRRSSAIVPWVGSAVLTMILSLASCGNDDPASPPEAIASPFPSEPIPPYQAVSREDLISRYVDHLLRGDRHSLRFAKEALGARGESGVPALVAALEAELQGEANVRAANLLSALVFTHTQQPLPILLDVLAFHPLPVVRSQAYDTIGRLNQRQFVPDLIQRFPLESGGPTRRLLACLGSLGGPQAAEFLAELTRNWLDPTLKEASGVQAFGILLEMEDPFALDALRSLLPDLPAPQRAPALVRLLKVGDSIHAEEVRQYLDPEQYPSASLRRQAIEGLAVVGDWKSVLAAAKDPDFSVRIAIIDALRKDSAVQANIGKDLLLQWADQADEELALPALRALYERGIKQPLDPWVARVRDYPAQGSTNALRLFLDGGVQHPQLARTLIGRWQYCNADQRIDLLRVLSVSRDSEALPFMESIVRDQGVEPEVRLHAIVSLGNFGAEAIPTLLQLWQEDPGPTAADRMIHALLRYPDDPRVRNLIHDLAVNPKTRDDIRATTLSLLVPAIKEDAYPILLEAREHAVRGEVRVYIDGILTSYF